MIEGVEFVVHWIAHPGACMRCMALSALVWVVPEITGILYEQGYPIYDLDSEVSLFHPNCMCSLDVEVLIDLERVDIGKPF